MNTERFSKSLLDSPLVTFNEFIETHENNKSSRKFEKALTKIKKVELDEHYVTVSFTNGKSIKLFYHGDFERYDQNGKMTSNKLMARRKYTGKDTSAKLSVCGTTMTTERFIAICSDIENDSMPLSYKGFTANVMDGSGRSQTAEKLGIAPNFHPSNIEWCLSGQNNHHGKLVRQLYKKTGVSYRFSAHDRELEGVFETKDKSYIIDYCQRNLIRVLKNIVYPK